MQRKVCTKKELEEALKDKVDVIIVEEKLANDLKAVVELKKLSQTQITAISAFLATSGTVLVAGLLATPVTGGISGLAAVASTVPTIAAASATSGVAISIIAGLVALAVVIGVSAVLELLKDYDVVEIEMEYKGLKFKRKAMKK